MMQTCKKIIFLVFTIYLLFFSNNSHSLEITIDENLLSYEKKNVVSGTIIASGSTTVGKVMESLGTEFQRYQNAFKISVLTGGSSTAPPALLSENINFALMSRPMNEKEISTFKNKFGYEPTELKIGIDAVVVFVNKNNPLNSIALDALDSVFSDTNYCGGKKDIRKWGDLGVKGTLADNNIILFGRTNASATYAYFQEKVLCNGRFKRDVQEKLSVEEIVKAIAETPAAIGYSSIGFITQDVKILSISRKGEVEIEPSAQNIVEGKYPLSRFLYIYLNKRPNRPINPIEEEFIRFIYSRQGQEIIVREGFIPINKKIADKMLGKLM